jgi:hypothetical protein
MSDGGTLAQWATVVGTLGGAALGFAASFFTALYNRKSESKEQKEGRDRNRFERIYELLIVVSQDNGKLFTEAVNSVHYARRPIPQEPEGIPPQVELEMLVSLYFKDLVPLKDELVLAIHNFGKEYVEALNTDYRNRELQEKQKVSGKLWDLSADVKTEIDRVKLAIADLVKS